MNTRASIIIIEDEKNICNFIETVLTPQNYQVTCAYTGTDGLKPINTHKPDVVLLTWAFLTWTAWRSYRRSGPTALCPSS